MAEVVFQLLDERVFDTLRTQEQLGYISGARFYTIEKNIVGSIVVQSSKYSVDYLEHRINTFLKTMYDKKGFTQEQFDNVQQAIIKQYE